MIKSLFPIFFLALFAISFAQIGNSYNFANSDTTQAYVDISTGSTSITPTGGADDGYANSLDISFNFNFNGTNYDKFGVSTNGWMVLGNGSTSISNALTTNLNSNIPSSPFIAPLWDDLNTTTGGIRYKTEGTSPNRILTVEWYSVKWNFSASGPVISFQVKLYENDGKIQFHYKQEANAVNSGSASICIATSSSSYLSVKTSLDSALSSTFVTNISAKPADNTLLTFTPVPMSYSNSSAKFATTGNKLRGFGYPIARLRVKTSGAGNPLQLTSINLSYAGTNVADIENLKIYYTGNSATFSASNQFGSTITAPSTSNTITGTQQLTNGDNYFWVYADIKATATVNDTVKYNISQITVSSNNYTPQDSIGSNSIIIKAGLSGTKTIGSGGDYANFSNAVSDLNDIGVEGPVVFEFMNGYTGENLSSAQTLNNIVGASSTNTITFRPASDVTNDIVIDASTNKGIVFNGTQYVIFDGRPGGNGTDKKIIIKNSSTSNPVIQFYNDAQYINLKFIKILGANTSSFGTPGVIYFGNANSTGNKNIQIDNCDIGNNGTSYPLYLIYSYGSSGKENKTNIISNCNLFNWRGSSSPIAIYIYSYNTNWYILNNNLYQSYHAGSATTTTTAIKVASGTNNVIEGNKIGGSAPNLGGITWKVTGTATTYKFVGIDCSFGAGGNNIINNNQIARINWLSSSGTTSGGGTWCGIQVTSGKFNISNNTIGSTNSNDTTMLKCSNLAWMVGMNLSGSTGIDTIANNTITGLVNIGTTASSAGVIKGIVTGGTTNKVIFNNTIGHATNTDALRAGDDGTSTSATGIVGIEVGSSGTNDVYNNTIANLSSYGTSTTAGNLWGIKATSGATNNIYSNSIYKLKSKNNNTGNSGSSTPTAGISATSGTNNINSNTVYDIENASTAAVYVAGIVKHTNGDCKKNKVYSIKSNTTNANVIGIYATSGISTYANNMVSVGSDITGDVNLYGVYDYLGTNNYYFNTVYVGGNVSSSSKATYAFNSYVTTNTRIFKNNIFVNNRNNISGTAKHYAVKYAGTSSNPTGLTSNYNNFYVNGSGGVLGVYNNVDRSTLSDWQTAVGQDNLSKSFAPVFVNTSTGDLHLNISSIDTLYIGEPISGITDDIDGETRNNNKPYIGADEKTDLVLPVELTILTASLVDNQIKLNWETSSEINSQKYVIEKNYDGNKWIAIGEIKSSGNSNTIKKYEYIDKIINSSNIKYRLRIVDNDGSFRYSQEIELKDLKPTKYDLLQNYPNPFNPTTKISFTLPEKTMVSLKIYNIIGQEIITLINNRDYEAGYYTIDFNAGNLSGGVYLYKLETEKYVSTKKLMLVK